MSRRTPRFTGSSSAMTALYKIPGGPCTPGEWKPPLSTILTAAPEGAALTGFCCPRLSGSRKPSWLPLIKTAALRWEVVARHNKVQKPYRLKKGMTLKCDSTHIVPGELSNGLVINLPELN